jgi:hypothetical protein
METMMRKLLIAALFMLVATAPASASASTLAQPGTVVMDDGEHACLGDWDQIAHHDNWSGGGSLGSACFISDSSQ